MLILLTFYLLENDRRSVEASFFISIFTVLSFKKTSLLQERLRNSSISIGKHSYIGNADTAVKWFQHCWEQTVEVSLPHSVPNPGEGPASYPLFLDQIEVRKGRRKIFWRPTTLPRPSPPPPHLLSSSGSGTDIVVKSLNPTSILSSSVKYVVCLKKTLLVQRLTGCFIRCGYLTLFNCHLV